MNDYRGDERRKDMKQAMKEAIREFLDDKFAEFGKWSFYGICGMALVVMTVLALKFGGWTAPK